MQTFSPSPLFSNPLFLTCDIETPFSFDRWATRSLISELLALSFSAKNPEMARSELERTDDSWLGRDKRPLASGDLCARPQLVSMLQSCICHELLPRYHSNPLVDQVWDHITFFFSVNKIVQVLHAYKFGPAFQFGHIVCLHEFPCIHRACSKISYFTTLYHIMQCFHSFFNGRILMF